MWSHLNFATIWNVRIGFHTLIKVFRSPPQPMWDLTIHPSSRPSVLVGTHSLLQSMWDLPFHPLRDPASLLAHRLLSTPLWGLASLRAHHPISSSDTIYNSPSPPLAYIVLFGLSLLGFLSRFARERFPHPYKGCFVLLFNQCGILY